MSIGATAAKETLLANDQWLSEVCGMRVSRVIGDADALVNESGRLLDALQSEAADFAFAKIGTQQVAAASALQACGFRVVDVNLSLRCDGGSYSSKPGQQGVDVREIACGASADESAFELSRIAGRCFRFSRFHLDPHFSNPLADRIKEKWTENYLRGLRGDRLWGAFVDGEPAGFLAAIKTADQTPVIDLIGVDSRFQGRGAGKALVNAFMEHYQSSDSMLVGTQAANTASLRLYQKQGFFFSHSAFVLHWHNPSRGDEHENR